MNKIKKIILTALALALYLIIYIGIQPEWLKYLVALLLLIGIWSPDREKH